MNDVDTRRYEMLVRVREFGTLHADLFPPASPGGVAFAEVAASVTALTEHAVLQQSGRNSAREATTSKAAAREALRDDLQAIADVASLLSLDDRFVLPPRNNDQALLAAARTFAREAAPLAARFVDHYLPENFLDDLAADIAEFDEAITDHEAGRDMHMTAGAAIGRTLQDGLDAVRRLKVLVPIRLRANADLLDSWERAQRIEYPAWASRRTRPAPDAAPATEPAAT